MTSQHISLTTPNDAWLKAQIEDGKYSSESDVVNDLISQARARQREIEGIRAKLTEAEKSGFTSLTPAEILANCKAELRRNGAL